MYNSLESSIALGDLETFVNPSNFLRWRQNWHQNYPDGMWVAYNTDFEEQFRFEEDDFLSNVRRLVSIAKIELIELKRRQLEAVEDTIDSEKSYGSRMRSMLNKIRASGVMSVYDPPIEKIFLQLERSTLEELKLNIGFTDPNEDLAPIEIGNQGLVNSLEAGSVVNPNGVSRLVKEMEQDKNVIPKDDSPSQLNAMIEEFKLSEKPIIKMISKHLGHFSTKNSNGYQVMPILEYRRLVQLVEIMLTENYQPEVDRTFAPLMGIVDRSLMHSFYLLMKEKYPSGTHKFIIEFLISSFEQLNDYKYNSIYNNFAKAPKFFNEDIRSNPFLGH